MDDSEYLDHLLDDGVVRTRVVDISKENKTLTNWMIWSVNHWGAVLLPKDFLALADFFLCNRVSAGFGQSNEKGPED